MFLHLANFDRFSGIDPFSSVVLCRSREVDLRFFKLIINQFFSAQQVFVCLVAASLIFFLVVVFLIFLFLFLILAVESTSFVHSSLRWDL